MTHSSPPPSRKRLPDADVTTAHTARVWNYWLGGKDNYPADREVGEQVHAVLPEIVAPRAQRGFLVRAVRHRVADAGILIMAHARALLNSTPEGATNYVYADLRNPDAILREAAHTLDFSRPIALMLLGMAVTWCSATPRLK